MANPSKKRQVTKVGVLSIMPCHPARARKLLATGKAIVAPGKPFSIQLTGQKGTPTPAKIAK